MKPIFLFSLFMAGSMPVLFSQNDGDHLFDNNVLHEIRFESPDENFLDQLVAVFNNAPIGEVPYTLGTVRIDGNLVPDIGVRIKGGISAFNVKRPLKIDFNRYIDDQAYDGMTKLNLQNADFDLTVQREAVVYDMFRKAGVKGPRTAFVKVFFNNIYNGVYIMVEQVDKNFLRNYFADDEGTLYKNKICELEVDAGENTFEPIEEIQQITATLSGDDFRQALESKVATDAFLRYFILLHFINSVDSPMDVGCNFYIYHEPRTGLLNWIPWDFNLAFFNGANYPIIKTNTAEPLFNKMMSEPYYRDRYLHLACDMLQYLLQEDYLYPRIDQNVQLINDAVMTDPYYTNFSSFDLAVGQMKTLISNRKMSFLNDLQALGFDCPAFGNVIDFQGVVINEFVASADSAGGIADPAGGYPDWLELYNNTNAAVALDGYYLSNDRDFLKHWAFPQGTQIGAGEYLIVWADRDVEESGLHTDFKLGKDGGQIFLTHEDFFVIDSVSYGEQNTNIAAARIPNGTGDFINQTPTFNANNAISAINNPAWSSTVELLLSPQPVRDQLTIQFIGGTISSPTDFRLTNNLGQIVASFVLQQDLTKVDVQHLTPGVYYLNGTIGQTRVVKRLVVAGQ